MSSTRNIVWIASYPKSGNTWVRFIVARLLLQRPLKNSGEVDKVARDIHKLPPNYQAPKLGRVILKTHWHCSPSMRMYAQTMNAIYIIRNPVDVLASNLDYMGVPMELRPKLIDEFIELGGFSRWGINRKGSGTWVENVGSWVLDQHPFPILTLSYEQLLSNPSDNIARIADHLGILLSESVANQIANETSFLNLKAMEVYERKVNLSSRESLFVNESNIKDKSRQFMHSGRNSGSQDIMSAMQKKRFQHSFGPFLKIIGYK